MRIEVELEELKSMEKYSPEKLLEILAENQQKIEQNQYYDEQQDNVRKEYYYHEISKNKSVGVTLFHAYHQLVTETHLHKYPYSISKNQYLYTWVDLQSNGQLKTIYSGKERTPERLIKEDFATIDRRFKRYLELVEMHDIMKDRLLEHLRQISRQHKFNTEHVVPQSWFRAKEPMKGDLHHLFVCEPRCNSLRSNYPYYEHRDEDPSNFCGFYQLNRFEPMYGKGVVARATLYFLLRYPTKITRRFKKTIDLPLLLRWHEQYNVTTYEKHRNMAIFEIQGNRNPFIDFPELVTKISFPRN
ncbi:endonuclease I family protein [Pseudogracilibacillus sp. SO30301A]|uniref:endonuclease I family protein n=1 Tax=Pseudogracilibacillus sp. SO30301A TaxID=3098291 RepID=UPI00300E45F8